ncbi:MAG: hypothetical protein RIR38_487 [Actinomycetota bacterium]|jgi:protein-tyrosine-phosphatase
MSAARFAALGDEVRLELIRFIQSSDRTVNELREYLEIGSSLLAHHLQVLEDVGLIERRQSAADGRKRFVVLRHENLPSASPVEAAQKVLFVCTENIARSQLASGIWSQLTGGKATSAGTTPGDAIHPLTVRAAKRHGIRLDQMIPKGLPRTIKSDTTVITVCDAAFEALGRDRVQAHWSIPDPVKLGTERAFDHVIKELQHRISLTKRSRT